MIPFSLFLFFSPPIQKQQTTTSIIIVLGVLACLLIFGIVGMVVVCERAKRFNNAYNVRKEARRLFRGRSGCIGGGGGGGGSGNDTVESIESPDHHSASDERRSRRRRDSGASVESGGSWDSYTTGRTGQSVVSPSATLYVSINSDNDFYFYLFISYIKRTF